MIKNALLVLLMVSFVGISAIATIQTVNIIYRLAVLQTEHDLMFAYSLP